MKIDRRHDPPRDNISGEGTILIKGGDIMDIIIERGAGFDVHKENVVACIMGAGMKKEIRTSLTMTNDLFRHKAWLQENRINHVAM